MVRTKKKGRKEGKEDAAFRNFRGSSNTPFPLCERVKYREDVAEKIKAVPLSVKTVGIAEQ